MSIIKRLYKDKYLGHVDSYICENIQYETRMGSTAYGVSSESSDVDLYSFTIPPKSIVFPHTVGYINGFGKHPPNFRVYQQHHINAYGNEYDINVYNIVDYFQLLMDNNPNMIDSLFTREQSVTFATKIGQMVKDNRRIFLHKGSWHRFRGYAYAQMKKLQNRKADPDSKRYDSIIEHGYDVKHAYHIVRLLNEVEQILTVGDIDLMQNKDQLKSVRAGEWSLAHLNNYFNQKGISLEKVYNESKLQNFPDEDRIKQLLMDCLEEFYGSINLTDIMVVSDDEHKKVVMQIRKILDNM